MNIKSACVIIVVFTLESCSSFFDKQNNINVYQSGNDYIVTKDTLMNGWHCLRSYLYSSLNDKLYYDHMRIFRISGDTLFVPNKNKSKGECWFIRNNTSTIKINMDKTNPYSFIETRYLGEEKIYNNGRLLKLYKFSTIENCVDCERKISYFDVNFRLYKEEYDSNEEIVRIHTYPNRIRQLVDSLTFYERVFMGQRIW